MALFTAVAPVPSSPATTSVAISPRSSPARPRPRGRRSMWPSCGLICGGSPRYTTLTPLRPPSAPAAGPASLLSPRPCSQRHPPQLSARARPQRRSPPRPSRGLVRGDGPHSRLPPSGLVRLHARGRPADAAGAPFLISEGIARLMPRPPVPQARP